MTASRRTATCSRRKRRSTIGAALLAATLAWSVSVVAAPRRPAPPHPPETTKPAALALLRQQYLALHDRRASFAAVKVARKGLALAIRTTGPESEDTEIWKDWLAGSLESIDDSAGAVALRKELLAATEQRDVPVSNSTLVAMSNLRRAYSGVDQFDEEEALMQRELAVTGKLYGERSVNYADALWNYSVVLAKQGAYSAQVPVLEQRLQIHEALAKADSDLLRPIEQLARACWWADQRPRAIALFDRMIAISGALTGKPGSSVQERAGVLSGISEIYREGDRDDLARALATKEIELYKSELTRLLRDEPDSDQLLTTLGYLSTLYNEIGDRTSAAAMLEQSYAIAVKRGDTTYTAAGMADLLRSRGKPREALAILERAEADIHRKFPGDSFTFSPMITDLLCELGDYARAERLAAEYRASIEKTYGRRAGMMYDIGAFAAARVYAAMGKPEPAARAMTDAFERNEGDLQRALRSGTEADHAMALSGGRYLLDLAINFELNDAPHSAAAARLGLTTVLRRKGRTLDAIAADLGAIRARLGPDDRRLLDALASARAQLARLTIAGPAATGDADFRKEVAGYEDQIQKLEIEVSRKIAAYRTAVQPIALAAVQKAIPGDARLVEFVSFQAYDRKATAAFGYVAPPRRYAAYVVRRTGDPALIDLGPAPAIDDAVEQLRTAVSDPDNDRAAELGHAVFALTMAKIAPALGGATSVLLAPDGALNLVPFSALVDDRGEFLIKRFTFTYLTSGRDLLRFTHEARPRSGGAIFADPSFDATAPPTPPATGTRPASRGRRSLDLAQQTWTRLPGTAQEADEIARQLPGLTMYRGPSATETALKAVHGPRILHVATHGFFLGDQRPPAANQGSPLGIQGGPASGGARENPLLRSGLVLAGANQLASGDDDGMLTAMEASGLDLSGTELVVLSACETGVGKITNGDGVYGLRRALVIAGAESLVMSLWQVDDAATRDLMAGFYARLAAGAPRSSALREIQLKLLSKPRYAHPYYWASFLPAGDNTPLR